MSVTPAIALLVFAAGFTADTPLEDWHAPVFVASLHRGELSVRGHVRSPADEALVAGTAGTARLELRRHIVLPDWWRRASLELLAIVPGLASGEVRMTRDGISVIGAAANERPVLDALRAALPADIEIIDRIHVIDVTSRTDSCTRLFAAFGDAPLQFRRASKEINSADVGRLTRLAVAMRRCPELRIAVEGHSDNYGTRRANERVSAARANAVRQFLVDQGVDAVRIEALGLGVSRPVAGNDTWEGRALNRRVELRRLDAPAGR